MAVRQFHIDVVVKNGQLHDQLRNPADRLLMIDRLNQILTDPNIPTDPNKKALRDGVVQILVDQLANDNGHEPVIIRTGTDAGDDDEQIVWHCAHADVEVNIGKYRPTTRTPHQGGAANNPFKFDKPGGNKGKDVQSGDYVNKTHSRTQRFYKFSLKGEDLVGNKLELDPCIICEK